MAAITSVFYDVAVEVRWGISANGLIPLACGSNLLVLLLVLNFSHILYTSCAPPAKAAINSVFYDVAVEVRRPCALWVVS